MSFNLPAATDPLRATFDLRDIAAMDNAEVRAKLRGIVDTRKQCRKWLKTEPEAQCVFALARTRDDDLVLLRVERAAQTVAWVFGTLRQFEQQAA